MVIEPSCAPPVVSPLPASAAPGAAGPAGASTSSPASRSDASVALGGACALILLVLLAYLPVLRAGYIWDDEEWLTENRTVQRSDGLKDIWLDPEQTRHYWPLVYTTFWLEYRCWGLRPLGYHLDNVLLHAVGAVLMWRTLRALGLKGAWFAAAVFALHPVHVESVAWVTERKNVLSGLLYFAAALLYLRFESFRGDGAGADAVARRRASTSSYAVASVFFLGAVLAKIVTCTLPAALLLVAWWRRGRLSWRDLLPLVPWFVVGLSLAALCVHLEKTHSGAQGGVFAFSLAERILIAGRAIWFYAGRLFWPYPLMQVYPRWHIDARQALQYAFPFATGGVLAGSYFLRRRIGRGPFAAGAFFVITLSPALGFISFWTMLYSFVADHYQYLASIGLIALAVEAAVLWLPAEPVPGVRGRSRATSFIVASTAAVILVALAALTWHRSLVYRSSETLWWDTLQKNPSCWVAMNNYAGALIDRGDPALAACYAEASLELAPSNNNARVQLGDAYRLQGRLDAAAQQYDVAIRAAPGYANAFCDLGLVRQAQGRTSDAADYYARAIEADPRHEMARCNLAVILAQQGRTAEARQQYEYVLRLNPSSAIAHTNLAHLMLAAGDADAARRHYRAALRAQPGHANALNGLGLLAVQSGELEAAERYLREALGADPNSAEAYNNLGRVLVMRGRRTEAAAAYRRALQLKPDFEQSRRNLGALGPVDSLEPPPIESTQPVGRQQP